MALFPVSLERRHYKSTDPIHVQQSAANWNRRVDDLEIKINKIVAEQPERSRTYYYSDIANRTGIDVEFIRKVCYSLDAGMNGFTGAKAD